MAHSVTDHWLSHLRQWIFNRLEQNHPAYQQRIFNNMDLLHTAIRKGDVLLVEGRSKMSSIIKFFSSSHWSHVALYVGDELIRPPHPNARHYQNKFGRQAEHLIVEAYAGQGVTVDALDKYKDFNIRICRPYGIEPHHCHAVLAEVIDNIGRRYDERNILDIALMLLATLIQPRRRRSHRTRLGSGSDFQVICSGMIAKAFQKVGYPIVPALKPLSTALPSYIANPYGTRLLMRHYSQILPRDFDLSPNFEVIKFNIIDQPFDYQALWQEKLN